jgi:hypothetical protein
MEYRAVLIDTTLVIDYLRNADKPTTKFISLLKRMSFTYLLSQFLNYLTEQQLKKSFRT